MPIEAPTNRSQLAGLPGQWSDTITGAYENLIVSETPAVVTVDLPLALNQTLLAFTPVMKNAQGNLVAAVPGTPAIGITLKDHVVAATGDLPGAPILIQGALNKDALSWPAAFDTDAEKFNAFVGADTPTAIVVKQVRRGSIIEQP